LRSRIKKELRVLCRELKPRVKIKILLLHLFQKYFFSEPTNETDQKIIKALPNNRSSNNRHTSLNPKPRSQNRKRKIKEFSIFLLMILRPK